jgi:hypothetical protein
MKEIMKKMRARAFWAMVGIGLILIAGAAAMVLVAENELVSYFTTKKELFETSADYLQEQGYYKCENNLLLDYYGSDDNGYYCITPVNSADGNGTYMGFYVYKKDFDTAQKIMDETWSGMETGEKPQTSLSGRGYVYAMSDDEKEYFRAWFEESGAGEDTIENLCYKTYVLVPISEAVSGYDIVWLLIAAVMVIVGIVKILSFLMGGYCKKLRTTMKSRNIYEEALVHDISQGAHFKNIDIGRKYTILYGASSRLLVNDDIIWAYLKATSTKHMVYGFIPSGTTTTYSLCFVDRNQMQEELPVQKETQGREILETLSKAAPHIIVGYDDSIKEAAASDFGRLVQAVEERKTEAFAAPQE